MFAHVCITNVLFKKKDRERLDFKCDVSPQDGKMDLHWSGSAIW